MLLADKVLVVTGGARGIGLACAQRFVTEGAKVVVADMLDDAGNEAVATIVEQGGVASYRRCDVTRRGDVRALLDFAIEQHGRVDTVIANAGIVHHGDVLELRETDFDRVLAVNLKGVFLTGQQAARVMLAQPLDEHGSRGTIINMSSVNAVLTIPTITPYAIAKGGVNQWTRSLAIRLAAEGVRVNAIGPGSINTEMFRSVASDAQKMHEIMSRTPMARAGEPDEVAKVAVFLASHYSSYITGQTIYPDGGRLGLNYVVPVAE